MEITHKTLEALRKASEKEYDKQLAVLDILIEPRGIIEAQKTLSRVTGEIKILTFLEYVLDNDSQAIDILNHYLNDVQEQKK